MTASVLMGVFVVAAAAQESPRPAKNVCEHYLEDQRDRGVGGRGSPWAQTEKGDRERRALVHKKLEDGALKTAEDFHDAAFIYQHGQTPDDYLLAHILAMVAVAKGDRKSLWISAATLDRYLTTIQHSQVFGTQYHSSDNSKITQEPFQPNLIPDALREVFCAPSFEQQQKNLAEFAAARYPAHIMRADCTR